MQRRNFLTSLAALGAAPLIPMGAIGGAATKAIGYNRYMYGIGVFHARTSASLGAAELAAKMAIPTSQAKLMLGEMISKGVVSPLTNTAGMVRAIDPINKPKLTMNEMLQKAVDWLDEPTQADQATVERSYDAPEFSQSPKTKGQVS